jgi:hypothetical protein
MLINIRTPDYLKLFPVFLFLTLVVELTGSLLMASNNASIYNLFSIIEFVFYLYIIKKILINRTIKMIIVLTMILYPLVALVNIFFIQANLYRLHVTTYSLGCLLITLFSIYYFYELFSSPASINLKREPAFWIITGLLFFYTCSFPIFGFANVISSFSVIARNIREILAILNVILYFIFAVGFLCKRFML